VYLRLHLREVFLLVYVILDVCLAGPVLLWPSAFSSEVPQFVAVVTLLYVGCLVLLGVLFELGGVPSALVWVLPWPPSVQWCTSPGEVHWDWYVV